MRAEPGDAGGPSTDRARPRRRSRRLRRGGDTVEPPPLRGGAPSARGIPTPPVTPCRRRWSGSGATCRRLRDPDALRRVVVPGDCFALAAMHVVSARRSVPSIDLTAHRESRGRRQPVTWSPLRDELERAFADPQPQPTRGPRAPVLPGPLGRGDRRRRSASPWARSSRGSTPRAQRDASGHRRRRAAADHEWSVQHDHAISISTASSRRGWPTASERAPADDVATALAAGRPTQPTSRRLGGRARGRRPLSWVADAALVGGGGQSSWSAVVASVD